MILSKGACGGGGGGIEFPNIDRHPPSWYSASNRGPLAAMPTYDPASSNPFQVDLSGFDFSPLDLRGSLNDLKQADFDDRTAWPPTERMPELTMQTGRTIQTTYEGQVYVLGAIMDPIAFIAPP